MACPSLPGGAGHGDAAGDLGQMTATHGDNMGSLLLLLLIILIIIFI
jgi:hypothetical protein